MLNPLLTSQTARGINRGRLMNLWGLSFVSLLTSWRHVFRHSGRSQVASHRSCCSKSSLCQELGSEKNHSVAHGRCGCFSRHAPTPERLPPSCPLLHQKTDKRTHGSLSFPSHFESQSFGSHYIILQGKSLCKPARRQRGLKNIKQGRALLS